MDTKDFSLGDDWLLVFWHKNQQSTTVIVYSINDEQKKNKKMTWRQARAVVDINKLSIDYIISTVDRAK